MHVQNRVLKLLCFLKIPGNRETRLLSCRKSSMTVERDRDTFSGATHRTGHGLSILSWNI